MSADTLDIGSFNLWNSNQNSSQGASVNNNHTVTSNYVQKITAPSTPLQGPTGTSSSTYVNGQKVYNPDFYGKGIFIISGASATAADASTVANFINPYGNNATYGVSKTHYFVVDILGQGAALYKFHDDSNGDNNIIGDELTPMVLLTGVTADSLNYSNFI